MLRCSTTIKHFIFLMQGGRTFDNYFGTYPGAYGLPVQYVLKTTRSFNELDKVAQNVVNATLASGKFAYADRDLKVDLPQTDIVLDRNKVAALVPMQYESQRQPVARAMVAASETQELWMWLMAGVILLLCAEVWMTRRMALRRELAT